MSNHAARRPAATRLAAFCAEEAGSVRSDMIVAGLAVVAVLGILIMSGTNGSDSETTAGSEETAAAAPGRMISSVGFHAPEPEPIAGDAERRSYTSPGYTDRFSSAPDNERARLDAETENARAAEAAAGGPPPIEESVPVAEETPASDEALAADDVAQEPPAGDGG